MPFKDIKKRRENVKKWKEMNQKKVKEQKKRWRERKKEERRRRKETQIQVQKKRSDDLTRKGKWINKVKIERLPFNEEQVKRCIKKEREEDI